MSCRFLALSALFLFALPQMASAQGIVEHLEPPVLQQGKMTRVAFLGSNFGKPVDLWTSLGAKVQAKLVPGSDAKRILLDVSVAADAPIGVAGLRLATEDGVTNAALFLVDDLPVQAAAVSEKPAKIAMPTSLWGRFREGGVDRFVLEAKAGERISLEAVANRLGKDVDPLITIRNSQGKIVAERDNDSGLYFDFRFEHVFAESGTHAVEFRDARFFGNEHAMYVLRAGSFPANQAMMPPTLPTGSVLKQDDRQVAAPKTPANGLFFGFAKGKDHAGSSWWPLETSSLETIRYEPSPIPFDIATRAKAPGNLCGILMKPGERHSYLVELTRGQKIFVRAEAKAFNSPAELEVTILDGAGRERRRITENPQEEIVADFQADQPGPYLVVVRDLQHDGGPSFVYRIEIANAQPRVAINAEVEGLAIPRGSYQPIPLVCTRTDYAGPIALSLVGAPEGMTLSPSEIPEGTTAIVCKLAAPPSAPLGLHTIQILARPANVPDAPPTLVRTRPLIDRQLVNVDLIVHALREDQRRLPPSVADRFTVQVTPPSPFDFELPEPQQTLARYQHTPFRIVTTRTGGFGGAIAFEAKGGQIAPKEEGRTRVYAELPIAGADKQTVTGSIHSRILTNLQKHRVEITGVSTDQGRKISLTRTFELEVKTAFSVIAEPTLLKMEPGAEGKVTLTLSRSSMFDGPVRVELSPNSNVSLPIEAVFPKGKTSVEIPVKTEGERSIGRHGIQIHATATVNGYEEEQRTRFDIDVAKPPPPKKK